MEYIKTLLALYRTTKQVEYLEEADYHIAKYEEMMVRYSGFPELYDANGDMMQTALYRSVRQTGWVIGFDQVRNLRRSLS